MTAIADQSPEGRDAQRLDAKHASGGAKQSPEPKGHTGDELARELEALLTPWREHHEAERDVEAGQLENTINAWFWGNAERILSALRPTQADNVLREALERITRLGLEYQDGSHAYTKAKMVAHAALKASPTTEPNPEGMQVAERVREAAAKVATDLYDLRKSNGAREWDEWAYAAAQVARGIRALDLSTLTSASNLSLIGPE